MPNTPGETSETGQMANTDSRPMKTVLTPPQVWNDPIVHWLRRNSVIIRIYLWTSQGLIPLLSCIFIVVPIGVLILPFFLPKFVYSALRRRKYEPKLSADVVDRISGTSSRGSLADRVPSLDD